MESNKEKIVYKGISRHVETLYISDSFNDCSKKIDMIVKIENLEQEKYVLECAEKDGFEWNGLHGKPTSYNPSKGGEECSYYLFLNNDRVKNLTYGTDIDDHRTFLTFEQFKAQREQSEFVKQSDELTIQNDLEKENEELKKKLREIENHCVDLGGENQYDKSYKLALNDVTRFFFQPKPTPSQTEANEIIKNASPEVLEELKKLL